MLELTRSTSRELSPDSTERPSKRPRHGALMGDGEAFQPDRIGSGQRSPSNLLTSVLHPAAGPSSPRVDSQAVAGELHAHALPHSSMRVTAERMIELDDAQLRRAVESVIHTESLTPERRGVLLRGAMKRIERDMFKFDDDDWQTDLSLFHERNHEELHARRPDLLAVFNVLKKALNESDKFTLLERDRNYLARAVSIADDPLNFDGLTEENVEWLAHRQSGDHEQRLFELTADARAHTISRLSGLSYVSDDWTHTDGPVYEGDDVPAFAQLSREVRAGSVDCDPFQRSFWLANGFHFEKSDASMRAAIAHLRSGESLQSESQQIAIAVGMMSTLEKVPQADRGYVLRNAMKSRYMQSEVATRAFRDIHLFDEPSAKQAVRAYCDRFDDVISDADDLRYKVSRHLRLIFERIERLPADVRRPLYDAIGKSLHGVEEMLRENDAYDAARGVHVDEQDRREFASLLQRFRTQQELQAAPAEAA